MFLTNKLNEELYNRIKRYSKQNGIEVNKDNIEILKKEYLSANPGIERQYNKKLKILRKLETGILAGTIAASTLAMGGIYTVKANDNEQLEPKVAVEATINQQEETKPLNQKDELKSKLEENRTQSHINELRKEIIIEQYNKENPEDVIEVDDLTIEESSQYLVGTVDKLGNIASLNRKLINKDEDLKENETIEKDMAHYIYKINGKVVAIYTNDGSVVQKEGEKLDDTFFKTTVPLINASVELKDRYKFESNENEKNKAEEKFINEAIHFENQYEKEKQENQLENA